MDESSLLVATLVPMAVLFTAGWLGGWTASAMAEAKGNLRRAGAHVNAASGGFLLGAGLFDFLPETHAHFEQLYPGHKFPYGFTICGAGFVAILVLERMLHDPTAAGDGTGEHGGAPMLTITLSVHGLLAGFAVGAKQGALLLLTLTLALAVHKFAAAFTLGSMVLRHGGVRRIFLISVGIFSVTTPFGVLAGSLFQEAFSADVGLLVEAIFDALAAGTFLYIAALDVIHETFFHKRASWWDVLMFVAGLTIIASMSLLE
jgi:zinc transporter 1/2/3